MRETFQSKANNKQKSENVKFNIEWEGGRVRRNKRYGEWIKIN